jgi:hypothetical protein
MEAHSPQRLKSARIEEVAHVGEHRGVGRIAGDESVGKPREPPEVADESLPERSARERLLAQPIGQKDLCGRGADDCLTPRVQAHLQGPWPGRSRCGPKTRRSRPPSPFGGMVTF